MLRIWEVLVLNHNSVCIHLLSFFVVVLRASREIVGWHLKLNHKHFLLHIHPYSFWDSHTLLINEHMLSFLGFFF
jgi:hypothetical protein